MAGAVGIVFGLCVLSFTLGAALMYVVLRRREDAAASVEPAAERPVDETWVPKPAVEPVEDDYDSRPIHRNPVVGLPQLEPALASLVEPVAPAAAEPVVKPAVAARLAEDAESVVDTASAAELAVVAELAAEPAAETELIVVAENVSAARYDRDGDFEPPLGVFEAPESTVAVDTDSSDVVELQRIEPQPDERQRIEPQSVEPQLVDPEFTDPEPVTPNAVEPKPVEPKPVTRPVVNTELPPPASPQPAEHTTWVEREDFRARYLRTFEEVRRKAGSN